MKIGIRTSVLATLVASVLWAPCAHATVVTLGQQEVPSTFTSGYECHSATECKNGHTFAELLSPDIATAPGVITSWRVNGAGALELRVLEPAPGGAWLGAGTSSVATSTKGEPNATELDIEAGDLIAADVVPGGTEAKLGLIEAPGVELLNWAPPLPEQEGRPADFHLANKALLLNAEVELSPVVTSVSPASGSTAGGNTVTISGAHLDGATNVMFGPRRATTFSVDQAGDRITATAPASPASTVDVYVSNLHSSSELVAADKYTFLTPPATAPATTTAGTGSSPSSTGKIAVSGFGESASTWRLGRSLPHISSAPVGTTFTFSLNGAAKVALTFTHSVPGRRANGRCAAPSHANATKPRCRRTIVDSLGVAGHAGLNKVRFQGRLSPVKTLAPGSYHVTVTERSGNAAKALTRALAFTILR